MIQARIAPRRRAADAAFRWICVAAVVLAFAFLAALLWTIFRDGFHRLNLDFFTSFPSRFADKAGIKVALVGTLWVMAITAVVAIPVGVAAAIFLEFFTSAESRFARFIQLNISNLAGVPSIVYGLLGLALFARLLGLGYSVLAGGLTMSLLILPVIIVVSQEAIRAVPQSYVEGSLALGATRWQTVWKQVLPTALPGIVTGIILSLSRAIGETAPLITLGAVTYIRQVPNSLDDRFTVLPIRIYYWASQPKQEFHENAAAAIIVLMAALLTMNAAAIVIRNRSQRKRR